MSILICVPTYNEEKAVREVIRLLREHHLDFVICDGFSEDNTLAIVKEEDAEYLKRDKVGKGYAFTKCLELAHQRGYEFMGIIDCDLTYDIGDLVRLHDIAIRQGYDMVVGGRPFSSIAWHRRLANYFISGYFNLLFTSKVKDIVSGLRIIRVDKFHGVISAISFDLEPRMLAYTIKNKLKYTEEKISYTERVGDSKANLAELFLILKGITHERIIP